jgi:hypothetical protein
MLLKSLQFTVYGLPFTIYPNPANYEITISSNINENTVASVFNTLSEKMLEEKINPGNSIINIKTWPQGIYIIKLRTKEVNLVQKIIKQ